MDRLRMNIRDLSADNGNKQAGMVAFDASDVEYVKWLVNEDEPEDSNRRVSSALVKIKGLDRPIETDAASLIGTLKGMVGKV